MKRTIDISLQGSDTNVTLSQDFTTQRMVMVSLSKAGFTSNSDGSNRSITVSFGTLQTEVRWGDITNKPNGKLFGGVITPSSAIPTTSADVYYVAYEAGFYTNFGFTLEEGTMCYVFRQGNGWVRTTEVAYTAEERAKLASIEVGAIYKELGFEEFDENTEYHKGDLVVYEGLLYEARYTHEGTWDPIAFDERNIYGIFGDNSLFGGWLTPGQTPKHGVDRRYFYLAHVGGEYEFYENTVTLDGTHTEIIQWQDRAGYWVSIPISVTDNAMEEAIGAKSVPSGGTTGQILGKHSDEDNDVEWIDPPEGGGTGDYEELDNLPSINGVTLMGELETEDLNIEALTNEEIDQLLV